MDISKPILIYKYNFQLSTYFSIRSLKEFGILDYLLKKEMTSAFNCKVSYADTKKPSVDKLRALSLQDFFGVFSVFAGGLFFLIII